MLKWRRRFEIKTETPGMSRPKHACCLCHAVLRATSCTFSAVVMVLENSALSSVVFSVVLRGMMCCQADEAIGQHGSVLVKQPHPHPLRQILQWTLHH